MSSHKFICKNKAVEARKIFHENFDLDELEAEDSDLDHSKAEEYIPEDFKHVIVIF